jgi:HEAT repeat protein
VRLAAVRVAGGLRVTSAGDALIAAVNDPQEAVRLAAMRALGDIRERRAVVALGEQFDFYRKGPAAVAAFDALARIGDPASADRFEQQRGATDPLLRRLAYEGLARAGRTADAAAFESAAASEPVPAVAVAAAFAAARAGRPTVPRIVRALAQPETATLAMAYLVELGGGAVNTRADRRRRRRRRARAGGEGPGARRVASRRARDRPRARSPVNQRRPASSPHPRSRAPTPPRALSLDPEP